MAKKMKLYAVEWSHGLRQVNIPKSEAMRIAADLLQDHDSVTITKYDNYKS